MTDFTANLKEGDKFRFKGASVTARKISKPTVKQIKNSHKTQTVTCRGDGYIVVNKTWEVTT